MSANTATLLEEAARHGQGDAQAALPKRNRDDLVTLLCQQGDRVSAQDSDAIYRRYCEAYDQRERREELVDAGSEMSFPASDPPSYMAGASVAGAPPPGSETREPVSKRATDPARVREVEETDGTGGQKADAPTGQQQSNASRR
ncbi:hypothetical protein SLNSH_11145 [Alsobacter soli]|uniref:Uncharacterized protein n=1 Tax=Alsobacter soli TaxID=2109933 RepID=A0A2T1HTN2_9HYPH|nr:hypothetical protein [Alsobacter soli]PSC04994.1 hypothetical protein SLNSH_11145 [Alsobacter soli]